MVPKKMNSSNWATSITKACNNEENDSSSLPENLIINTTTSEKPAIEKCESDLFWFKNSYLAKAFILPEANIIY